MHFSYEAPFYGRNVLDPDFRERAFMATYQDLGYYSEDILTVLSPVRRVSQSHITTDGTWTYAETPLETTDQTLLKEAEAYYQSANQMY